MGGQSQEDRQEALDGPLMAESPRRCEWGAGRQSVTTPLGNPCCCSLCAAATEGRRHFLSSSSVSLPAGRPFESENICRIEHDSKGVFISDHDQVRRSLPIDGYAGPDRVLDRQFGKRFSLLLQSQPEKCFK